MVRTKIEWADAVWNPVIGCTPVSEGCDNCYARRMAYRLRGRCGYPQNEPFRVTLHPERLNEPLKWKNPRKVFVCSMGDLFHEDVSFANIAILFGKVMREATQHTFLILTKRPERMRQFFSQYPLEWPEKYPHVWIGITAENQEMADKRIPVLLQIPAAVRFVSVEPMLGPIDLSPYLGDLYYCNNPRHGQLCPDGITYAEDHQTIICRYCKQPVEIMHLLDWVICGGETGPNARPMHPDWVRGLRDQCQDAGVPFFFKSWGEFVGGQAVEMFENRPGWSIYQNDSFSPNCDHHWGNGIVSLKVGKKAAGRLLDGRTWDEFPRVS